MPQHENNKPVQYDAQLGANAFESLAPARDALGPEVAAAPRLDMGAVAVVALGVAARIAEPSMRARLRNVEKELAASSLERLEPAAWALWHASMQRDIHEAKTTQAMLPVELVEQSAALEATMLQVARYVLGDDPVVAREIASIASGSGYLDLASDLGRLAALFDAHSEALATDRIRYHRDQPKQARALAARIVKALGQSGDRPWTDAVNRSYALLELTYEPIREFGRVMYRQSSPDTLFPSLFSVRVAPTRPRNEGSDSDTPPV